ncbi:alpha-L-rhamnosidase-related protein [Cohnella nanjingensis]|uniref:Alpha-L-rhamnosidase N-terminal domain-containing protein n=1 Tax=Cohnella nanjingensis TaxID=1387779 RepID=A0A7X0RTM8_9BACL|nr:alpha-L-rhamnosidase C-terminal domain-containing protein [Cohnella nanjingensis]MBB6672256.1 alpha-L-rhamnosidase N-terminal domain-containing protein [Cohnella nanjingensis]
MEENRNWRAKWIWGENRLQAAFAASREAYYFRRSFDVPEDGGELVVRVSADSRYRLFLNGESVSVGPCKGDGKTHYYETVDVTKSLRPGKNTLAAKVVHYRHSQPYSFGDGPVSVWRASAGAFLLEGELHGADGTVIASLHSDGDGRWKCLKDESGTFEHGPFTFFVGGVERIDGAKMPHGWERVGFDDSSWEPAVVVSGTSDSLTGQLSPWQLSERPIPPLFEHHSSFKSVVRSEGGPASAAADRPIRLEPHTKFMAELDAGELTTGYLTIKLVGGEGSVVKVLCSECYEPPTDDLEVRRKGVRDRHEGNVLLGEYDRYAVAGVGKTNSPECYEPFWFRTFRFVRLEVETGGEPLEIVSLAYRETGYPLEVRTSFACSDDGLKPLWEISINTLRRCMHETYEDCPFYEQLQYIMDTRLQILFTYYISGDDRLARRAIHDFHSSMLPSGMLQSRYPAVYQQVIPGFSLYWILMLHDHYLFFGDDAFVRRYRPTIDAVLDWFDRRITADGIVGACPDAYWSYVDWVEEWKTTFGMPTAGLTGPITVYSLMYAAALAAAADLNEWTGRRETAVEYRERGDAIKRAVRAHCWSEQTGLFRDGPHSDDVSEHAQIWSVLSGTVTGEAAVKLMSDMLSGGRKLPKVSYAMSFFLFRALSCVGLYDRTFPLWDEWRHQAEELRMSTWLEDPVTQRSDCHAWGAIPLYEFPAEILGIKPGAPGYRSITVEPKPCGLKWAKGSAMTPHGPVLVSWHTDGGRFRLQVERPDALPLRIVLPDGTQVNHAEAGPVEASCIWGAHSDSRFSYRN